MARIRQIRIASAIATVFLCGGLARAQDASASWLLHTPQASGQQVLNLSLTPTFRLQTELRSSSQSASSTESSVGTRSAPAIAPKPATAIRSGEHRFWDATNDWLFAGVGASRTLDYFSTLNMRRRGRQEILLTNDVVDNHAAFAVIEAAGTGASIGVSYLFHHYGHHKLERATSIVHIGLATTGAVRNYCLKTAHPAIASPVAATSMIAPGFAPIRH